VRIFHYLLEESVRGRRLSFQHRGRGKEDAFYCIEEKKREISQNPRLCEGEKKKKRSPRPLSRRHYILQKGVCERKKRGLNPVPGSLFSGGREGKRGRL